LPRINPHQPPEKAAPFPANDSLRRITESLRTIQADPYVPVRLRARDASDMALNVGVGQMGE